MAGLPRLDTFAHDRVTVLRDPDTGLAAVLAVHDLIEGRAAGGWRVRPYARLEHAITDALDLAELAARRHAVAGIPAGGGGLVVAAEAGRERDDATVAAVRRLAARADAGFHAIDEGAEGGAGLAAEAVVRSLAVALRHVPGASLEGARVAIQGLGPVGQAVCAGLAASGASIVLTDADPVRRAAAARLFGAQAVAPEAIYGAPCDAFVPCGCGGTLGDATIHRLRARVVAGPARGQLQHRSCADRLQDLGILWVPEVVAGAGATIWGLADVLAPADPGWAARMLDGLERRLDELLTRARAERTSPERLTHRLPMRGPLRHEADAA